jgi:Flp pilus assembly protein TadG
MCWNRSDGADDEAGLMARSSRFHRDETGAGTVFSLGLLFIAALLGGLAVDVGNAWRYNELLKTTADVAAHAGAVVLSQGGTPEDAREAALAALDYNMPEAHYGRILVVPAEDVRPVHYDAATNQIAPGRSDEASSEDGGVNAIAVRVQRSAASGNPIPTMLLRLAGSKAWDVMNESVVAMVATQRCQSASGLYAKDVLLPGPGSRIGKDVCLHAQGRVIPGEGSLFETGSGLSMPDLARCGSNCTDAVAQGSEAARFEANLIRPDLPGLVRGFRAQLTAPLRQMTQNQTPARDAYFAKRELPGDLSALDEVGVPIDRLKTGMVVEMSPAAFMRLRAVPQGLVYRVMCAPPPGKDLPGASIPVPLAPSPEGGGMDRILTLSGRDLNGNPTDRVYRNMVLISDCQIRIDATAKIEGAVILSVRGKGEGGEGAGFDIIADTGAAIGDPDRNCDPDHRSTLMALGSVLLPAGAAGTNVGVLAGGDIRISPPDGPSAMLYGVTGLGLHAGGTISVDVTHDYSACAAGGDAAADPFSPDLMVLRQVEPTPKAVRADVGAEGGSES